MPFGRGSFIKGTAAERKDVGTVIDPPAPSPVPGEHIVDRSNVECGEVARPERSPPHRATPYGQLSPKCRFSQPPSAGFRALRDTNTEEPGLARRTIVKMRDQWRSLCGQLVIQEIPVNIPRPGFTSVSALRRRQRNRNRNDISLRGTSGLRRAGRQCTCSSRTKRTPSNSIQIGARSHQRQYYSPPSGAKRPGTCHNAASTVGEDPAT